MNEFLNAMKENMNYTTTENGAITHKTTNNKVLDMFAMGGSMRSRSENDITNMFFQAYSEDKDLALKCLFYLRDARGGQGERRFFRICIKWLANFFSTEMSHLIPKVAEYGRYDDLFELFDTPVEEDMMKYVKEVIETNDDYLVYKWMPSINASSTLTKKRGRRFARFFNMSEAEYRHMLSEGRENCHLVETLMSQHRWDQIAFDKLPSKAGLLYKRAFMRREETKERYKEFMANKTTKVNASVLNPVDIAHQIFQWRYGAPEMTERNAWQKYWDALPDYYNGKEEPGIAVVDVSGSMFGTPMEAAVSMGAYIAERGKGPFKNHFITFSVSPDLIEFNGVDIYAKFQNAKRADWGYNTDIKAVFDLLLQTALNNKTAAADMPKVLYIFSDMEFDMGLNVSDENKLSTLIERIQKIWKSHGYELPRIIFWNLDARHENIPALGSKFSYVSGFSMNMIEYILSGKTGLDLMLEKLNSKRYEPIHSIYSKSRE